MVAVASIIAHTWDGKWMNMASGIMDLRSTASHIMGLRSMASGTMELMNMASGIMCPRSMASGTMDLINMASRTMGLRSMAIGIMDLMDMANGTTKGIMRMVNSITEHMRTARMLSRPFLFRNIVFRHSEANS